MEQAEGAAIIGGLVGLLLMLAPIFNWRIVPTRSDTPSVGPGRAGMGPGVRAMVGIVGAILVVLACLFLSVAGAGLRPLH